MCQLSSIHQENERTYKIAVIIPSYKVKNHILKVIADCSAIVTKIYVVDDCCPDHSGEFVKTNCHDPRVQVIFQKQNTGVGGAVMTGYQQAINDGMDILVKIDGDGQMDPSLIEKFIQPILKGQADYTKGNRFWNIDDVKAMPKIRLFGNAGLSFMNKLSSGYWNIFDPTNGYTAISAHVAKALPFEKISKRYFFETDLMFRLSTMRAVIVDIPMKAKYEDEVSGLSIKKIMLEFMLKHIRNTFKRFLYNYFLRDFSIASIEILVGTFFIAFGLIFGSFEWIEVLKTGSPATSGTVMLAALPIFIGLELLISFLNYDINNVPKDPIGKNLK